MTKPIKLTLPYPPSANRYWRRAGHIIHLSDEARAYREDVGLAGTNLMQLAGNVSVSFDVYRPRRARDLDNCLKVILDALQGVAYTNDSQVTEIWARRFDDKANPRVEVTITPNE